MTDNVYRFEPLPDPPADRPRDYPLPRPEEDPRFTHGLFFEIAAALERHGYPKIQSGRDLLELKLALFGFLYEKPGEGT